MNTRAAEIEQYNKAYQQPEYAMGVRRKNDALRILRDLAPLGGSFLDVGTGRGETLQFARDLGFSPVMGTEVVHDLLVPDTVIYGELHALPLADASWDHVTCFDVLEHLVPEDTHAALQNLFRVAKRTLTFSASEQRSIWNGRELHINRRPVKEWERAFAEAFGFVPPRHGTAGRSPCWQIRKA